MLATAVRVVAWVVSSSIVLTVCVREMRSNGVEYFAFNSCACMRSGSTFSSEFSGPTGIDRNNLVLDNQKQALGEVSCLGMVWLAGWLIRDVALLFGLFSQWYSLALKLLVLVYAWCVQGYYGAVYKGTLTNSRQIVAVKCVHFKQPSEAERELLIRDFKQEINLMKRLKHPNIVQIFGQCENYSPGRELATSFLVFSRLILWFVDSLLRVLCRLASHWLKCVIWLIIG